VKQNIVRLFIWMLFLTVSACAGYRSGYFSRPYINDVTAVSAKTNSHKYEMRKIDLEELKIGIDLRNETQTSDIAVMIVPVKIDTDDKPTYTHKSQYTIGLSFFPLEQDLSFTPEKVSLFIDGTWYPALRVVKMEYLFPDRVYTENRSTEQANVITLSKAGYCTYIDISFDVKVPTPDQDIKLDLQGTVFHS